MANLIPYRENANSDIVDAKQLNNNLIFEVRSDSFKFDYCPLCLSILRKNSWGGTVGVHGVCCSPTKRYFKRKFLIFKSYCKISGWHQHYNCDSCNCEWFVRIITNENTNQNLVLAY